MKKKIKFAVLLAGVILASSSLLMVNNKPKIDAKIYGKAVIRRVVEAVRKAGIEDIAVIVGENRKEIEEILKDEVQYVFQENCLGTGHAIMQASEYLKNKQGRVLILN